MKESNYEIMKKKMQVHFLEYDQGTMIRRFGLECDDDFLYIGFAGRMYRIGRNTGAVEWSEDGFVRAGVAGYNEAMTIFDVLCCSRENCRLSGEFVPVNDLPGVVAGSRAGNGLFQDTAKFFDSHTEALRAACERMGGVPAGKADVGYELKLFDFLPVRLNFWNADEEFPASLRMLWDRNLLDFMHYETSYFAAGHLMGRLKEIMQEIL